MRGLGREQPQDGRRQRQEGQEAVGQARQDRDLVGGIPALHIRGRIGFGVAQALGIGEHIGVGRPLHGHAAEDVVGGAVDDAAHPLDAVQRLRADVVTEPNQRDAFQAIAPATQDGLYLVPQVIE